MRHTVEQISDLLKSGNVAAVPTETVYGLAACMHDLSAVEKIFAIKQRPLANPLIIHVADKQTIEAYALKFPPQFQALAEAFWPGPLTLILPAKDTVPSLVRAALPTAGFRIPSLAITRSLLAMTGPLVMPSANLSGRPSATSPEHVEEDFGADFPVLDGGLCLRGLESTILFYQEPEWVIARQGALSAEELQMVLGYLPRFIEKKLEDGPICPGQLYRHYAPRARLFLGNAADLPSASFIIGFKERNYPTEKSIIFLGSVSNPEEVAENLYKSLRQLDRENALDAWVDMDFPRTGLWQTIAERLERAGEKR